MMRGTIGPQTSERAGGDDLIFLEIGPLDVGCLVVDRLFDSTAS